MRSIAGAAAVMVVTMISVGRLLYLVHTPPADDSAVKRFLLTFAPSCCKQSSRKTPQKSNIVIHVHRHCERKVRARPRKARVHPSSSTIADGADGWEEYIKLDRFLRFLELLLEIREEIYNFAMDHLSTQYFVRAYEEIPPLTVSPATLPYLCFVSKQLHSEVLASWIRRTRFMTLQDNDSGYILPLMTFLSHVNGFKHVRMLSCTWLSAYGIDPNSSTVGANTRQNLATNCTGLCSLTIGLNDSITKKREEGLVTLKTKDELAQDLRFGPIYQLDRLRRLKIEVAMTEYWVNKLSRRGGLTHLAEMVTEGFEAVGKVGIVKMDLEFFSMKT